ncbi:MAG: hypothetical protein WBW03_13480, partial [Silvibacterium sp.]
AMPFAVRLKYLAPQVVLVGSRHPRLRRRVSPLLHYTIIGIALAHSRLALLLDTGDGSISQAIHRG